MLTIFQILVIAMEILITGACLQTEGGKSTNRQNMLEIIRQMAEELKPEYFISDKAVYSKFTEQYER